MNCKDCKYWSERDQYEDDKGVDVRKCTRVKMFWDCTEWGDEDNNYERRFTKQAEGDKAFVKDGSDYIAHLLTLGDFGCNQFEAKALSI
jgi:hypothetical protein